MLILPLIAGGKGGTGRHRHRRRRLAGAAILGPDQVLKHAARPARAGVLATASPTCSTCWSPRSRRASVLDAAVTRVTEELARRYPNLTVHLRFLVLELRAGRARKDAWSAFADRLGIDDARALATMLRQAEEMGTSLGETLTVFSARHALQAHAARRGKGAGACRPS